MVQLRARADVKAAIHAPGVWLDDWPVALAVVQFPEECPLTDELLIQLGELNTHWQFERTAAGGLQMTFAVGGTGGELEAELGRQLGNWCDQTRRGRFYSVATGFNLTNGAMRMADGAWVSDERLAELTPEQRRGLLGLCPDFVFEVRSPSQRLEDQQAKMVEWLENGVRVGMLVSPDERLVFVYRPGRDPERHEHPQSLSAEPELAGFSVDFAKTWALI